MSVQTTQLKNSETVLPPASVERLSAKTDVLVELVLSKLRHHLFDNTGALGSTRHIPTSSQQLGEFFIQYVGGEADDAALKEHVAVLARDGLSPKVAVIIADEMYGWAMAVLGDDEVASVLHRYRQLFLHLYIEARLGEILVEQETFYKSSQSLLEERIKHEHQLGLALEKEQHLTLKQATELELVANISVHTAVILDPHILVRKIAELTNENFALYRTFIYLFDANQNGLVQAAIAGSGAEQLLAVKKEVLLLHQKDSLVAEAARTRRVVMQGNMAAEHDFLEQMPLPRTRSELAVPIVIGKNLLGVLDMHAAEVDRFGEEDARILLMLAAQTGVSLQNARQYQQTQEALEDLNRLQQVMTHENWSAFLSDDDRQVRGYMFDNEQLRPIGRERVAAGASTVLKTAVFPDRDIPLSIPMKVRDETIGFLDVRDPSGKPLTEDDQLLLEALSGQIADALERARLLEMTELGRQELDKRAEQLEVINQMAQVVSQQLEEEQLFTAVHEQVARAVVTDTFFIAMYNEDRNQFSFPYFYDDHQLHKVAPISANPLLETTQVLKSGESIYINYTPEEFWDREAEDNKLLLTGDGDADETRRPSNLAFTPLMAGAKAVGVMSVQNYQFHDFTEDDISLLFGIANHVGLALENLRLFTETQQRAERERLINEISQKIQGAQTVQGAMQTAVTELGRALNLKKAVAKLN